MFFNIAAPHVQAQEFVPLVGIPYVDTSAPASLAGYVNALYTAAISIAAFMAVVKIIFAGVKYMLSDVVTSKEDAKKDIRGALIGLLIVVGAVLILNTINPQLKGLRALDGPPINVELRGGGQNSNYGQSLDWTNATTEERFAAVENCTGEMTPVINQDGGLDCIPKDTIETGSNPQNEVTAVYEARGETIEYYGTNTRKGTPEDQEVTDQIQQWDIVCSGKGGSYEAFDHAASGDISYICVL